MIKYYPYKSDKPDKKYYIITNNDKKVYFGMDARQPTKTTIRTFSATTFLIFIIFKYYNLKL